MSKLVGFNDDVSCWSSVGRSEEGRKEERELVTPSVKSIMDILGIPPFT